MKMPILQKQSILSIAMIVTLVALLATVTLLILHYQGMETLKPKMWKTYLFNSSYDSNNNINVLTFDQQGGIWVGTNRAGLKFLSPEGELTSYTIANSELTSDLITALAVDNDNRVWIGTDAGLNLLKPDGDWILYTKENSALQDDWVEGLVIDHQNRVWTVTGYELFALSPDGSWQAFNPPYGEENVAAIAVDSTGKVWIGIHAVSKPALYMMDANGKWKSFDIKSVDDLAIDDQNRIWVSTSYQGDVIMIDTDGKMKFYRGENAYYTGSIAVDQNMQVWFEGMYGNDSPFLGWNSGSYIGMLTPGEDWKTLSLKDAGLSESSGFRIAIDEQERIWIAQDDSLSTADPDLFRALSNLSLEITKLKWITTAFVLLLTVLLIMFLPQPVRLRIKYTTLLVVAGIIGGSLGGFLGWEVGFSIGVAMNQGLGAIVTGIIGLALGAISGTVIVVQIILSQRS